MLTLDQAKDCLFKFAPPFYTLSQEQQRDVSRHFCESLTGLAETLGVIQAGVCITEFIGRTMPESHSEGEAMLAPIRAMLASAPEDHPGRNDMLLVRWAFTGDLTPLRELHQATKRVGARGETAQWAIGNLTAYNAHFAADFAKALASN